MQVFLFVFSWFRPELPGNGIDEEKFERAQAKTYTLRDSLRDSLRYTFTGSYLLYL